MKNFPFVFAFMFVIASSFIYWILNDSIRPVIIVISLVVLVFLFVKSYLKKDADYQKNLILVIGFCITISSWFVSGYINNHQATLQAKRELKTRVLLDAYFRLENADFRDTTPSGNKGFLYDYIYIKYSESALTSIQLLANDSTVRLANEYIISRDHGHFSDLLIALRSELRSELDLKELPTTIDYHPSVFRSFRKINAPNDLSPEQQYQLIIKLNEFDRNLIK